MRFTKTAFGLSAAILCSLASAQPVAVLNGSVEVGQTDFNPFIERLKQDCPNGVVMDSRWDKALDKLSIMAIVEPRCFNAGQFSTIMLRNFRGKIAAVVFHYPSNNDTFAEYSDVLTEKYGQKPMRLDQGTLRWTLPAVTITHTQAPDDSMIIYESVALTAEMAKSDQGQERQRTKDLL